MAETIKTEPAGKYLLEIVQCPSCLVMVPKQNATQGDGLKIEKNLNY